MNTGAIGQETNPPSEITGQMGKLSAEIVQLEKVVADLIAKCTNVLPNGSLPPETEGTVQPASPVPTPFSPLGKAIEHMTSDMAACRRLLQLLTNNLSI